MLRSRSKTLSLHLSQAVHGIAFKRQIQSKERKGTTRRSSLVASTGSTMRFCFSTPSSERKFCTWLHFDASKGCLSKSTRRTNMIILYSQKLIGLVTKENQGYEKSLTAFRCPGMRRCKSLNTRPDPASSQNPNVSTLDN